MIDSLTKKQKISFGLGMALPILLLPSTHQNEKVIFTDILAITWLVYSILYQRHIKKGYFIRRKFTVRVKFLDLQQMANPK